MKKLAKHIGLGFLVLSIILHSCKKDEVPTVTTSEITDITGTSATSGGTITDEGSGAILERGVCWSTETPPTITDNKTTNGSGAGTFISNISEMTMATTYYVRAYATNDAGTGYGMAISFSTLSTEELVVDRWNVFSQKVTVYKNNVIIQDTTAYYTVGEMAIEFLVNGTGNEYENGVLNDTFTWSQNGDSLVVIITGQDPISLKCIVNGDTMTLNTAIELTSGSDVYRLVEYMVLKRD
jgi:hypothetical protein